MGIRKLLCSAATCYMVTNAFIFSPSDNFKRKFEGVFKKRQVNCYSLKIMPEGYAPLCKYCNSIKINLKREHSVLINKMFDTVLKNPIITYGNVSQGFLMLFHEAFDMPLII